MRTRSFPFTRMSWLRRPVADIVLLWRPCNPKCSSYTHRTNGMNPKSCPKPKRYNPFAVELMQRVSPKLNWRWWRSYHFIARNKRIPKKTILNIFNCVFFRGFLLFATSMWYGTRIWLEAANFGSVRSHCHRMLHRWVSAAWVKRAPKSPKQNEQNKKRSPHLALHSIKWIKMGR